MAKKVEEASMDFTIDTEGVDSLGVPSIPVQPITHNVVRKADRSKDINELKSCLSNRTIIVRFVPQSNSITDKRHVLSGGMAETAFTTYTVPRLRSGILVDVLTHEEKDFLEAIMGLEAGAMNIYNRDNNFWDSSTEGGVNKVRLSKSDTVLKLNNPIDYIKYKILLANKASVAPSLQVLQDSPKATYKYVLIAEDDISSIAKTKLDTKKQCYIEYGKIENNEDVLRTLIEILTAKPLAASQKLEFLQTKISELIEGDARTFLRTIRDPQLLTKVLIQKCIAQNFIAKRGNYLYNKEDNSPLCENGQEPTLSIAAQYLDNPKHQNLKMMFEAKVQ